MIRQNYNEAIVEKKLNKDKKVGEMKRIWLNHDKQPVEQLYGSLLNA